MRQMMIAMLLSVLVTGCNNYVPREKTAKYDPETHSITMPYPCPDWSQSQTSNYLNQPHSNFGCAVNTNSALQLAYPEDLHHGTGDSGPDMDTTTGVITRYRSGGAVVAPEQMQTTDTQ